MCAVNEDLNAVSAGSLHSVGTLDNVMNRSAGLHMPPDTDVTRLSKLAIPRLGKREGA